MYPPPHAHTQSRPALTRTPIFFDTRTPLISSKKLVRKRHHTAAQWHGELRKFISSFLRVRCASVPPREASFQPVLTVSAPPTKKPLRATELIIHTLHAVHSWAPGKFGNRNLCAPFARPLATLHDKSSDDIAV
jgi:hypothetical protein